MEPLIALLSVILAAGIYLIWSAKPHSRWRAARHFAGVFFVALPIGGLAYLFAGIEIARWRGVGHFFSVPFGGYAVSDSALLGSLASWVVLFSAMIKLVLRSKTRR
jgi:hypothetical protein